MTIQNADMHTTDLQLDLARRIVAHLRDRSAPAGARVSSAELAAEFRVSRSPVTRALTLLLERGILEKTPTGRLAVVRDMAGVELDAVAPASETEELFTRIMQDRARGELPAEVSESELIPRYGASRGLIRRLMMRFAAEGLAERQQGQGWRFVALLDATQLKASYQFRLIVECSAFRIPGYDAQLLDAFGLRIIALGAMRARTSGFRSMPASTRRWPRSPATRFWFPRCSSRTACGACGSPRSIRSCRSTGSGFPATSIFPFSMPSTRAIWNGRNR